MTSDDITTTVYLQVEPRKSIYSNRINSAAVVAHTLTKPARPKSGTVTVKLNLQIPIAAFLPLEPEATVVIPAALAPANIPIVVEATDPEDGQ